MTHPRPIAAVMTLLVLLTVLAGRSARAQAYDTPKPGSFERKLLMDTLRLPVESRLHKPVIFQVTALRVRGDWAFMTGIPIQPNGRPFDYRGTPYAAAARMTEAFSGGISALLHKIGGHWRVLTYNIGASDLNWYDWDKRYGCPRVILGRP